MTKIATSVIKINNVYQKSHHYHVAISPLSVHKGNRTLGFQCDMQKAAESDFSFANLRLLTGKSIIYNYNTTVKQHLKPIRPPQGSKKIRCFISDLQVVKLVKCLFGMNFCLLSVLFICIIYSITYSIMENL